MRDWDPVEGMHSDDAITAFLESAASHNDEDYFLDCLRDAARAREINRLAAETGIDRKLIFELFANPEEDEVTEIEKPSPVIVAKISAVFGVTAPVHA